PAGRVRSFSRLSFSWRTHRGKIKLVFVLILFVADAPRKAFARFCAHPFRGGRTAESSRSFLRPTFPWQASRGKLSLIFAPNLFVADAPRKAFAHFCAQPFRGGRTAERSSSFLRP